MDQTDIDALLAGSGFSATTVVEENPPDTAEVDPNDIDALLAGTASDSGEMGQTDIDDLLAGTGIEATPAAGVASMEDMMGDASEDEDMDALLGDMGFGDMVGDDDAPAAPKLDSLVSTPAPAAAADLDSMLESADPEPAPAETGGAMTSMETKLLMEMPLTLTFEVGRARMAITDLLSLGQGSVLELHRLVGEDLDLFVNGELIARGEVVVVNEKFGARIIEIISPRDRIKRMGGLR